MSMGVWEIGLILVIVFVIFGAGKLPQVMSDLGKGVKGLKHGLKEEQGQKPAKIASKDSSGVVVENTTQEVDKKS